MLKAQQVYVQEEKIPSTCKWLFCRCGCPCLGIWFVGLPLLFLALVVIIGFVYLEFEANLPPPLVTIAAGDDGDGMRMGIEGTVDPNELDRLVNRLEKDGSAVQNAVTDFFEDDIGVTVTITGASDRRRLLEMDDAFVRRQLQDDKDDFEKFNVKLEVPVEDELDEEMLTLLAEGKRSLNKLAKKLSCALLPIDANATNATNSSRRLEEVVSLEETMAPMARRLEEEECDNSKVTVKDIDLSGTYSMQCNFSEPFRDNRCGGLVNRFAKTQFVKDAIKAAFVDCVYPDEGASPVAYFGNESVMIWRSLCTIEVAPSAFACALENALRERIDTDINTFIRGLGQDSCLMDVSGPKLNCFHYLQKEPAQCETRCAVKSDVIVCESK